MPGFGLPTQADTAGAHAAQNGSGSVAAATATATLPAVPGKTNYLTGVIISGLGSTAGGAANLTITGILGGTLTIPIGIPAGIVVPVYYELNFATPLEATGPNVAIAASTPTWGGGNTNASVSATGYTL
jgi:hypothetical protein